MATHLRALEPNQAVEAGHACPDYEHPSHLDEIRCHHGSAAGPPGLAVHIDAVTLLAVPQQELDAPLQLLQAGRPAQVHGAEPQLLHPQCLPFLSQTAP